MEDYKLKDISVIIPTYNRVEDLRKTLEDLKIYSSKLCEIIIVDQSTNNLTKELIKKFKIKNLKYIFSSTPAITIARNLGVKNSSTKSRIICFLDDDVTVQEKYFEEILKIFNDNPDALGVTGYNPVLENLIEGKIDRFLKKLFFLGYLEKCERARVVSAYGNTYPLKLNKIINSEWLPGVNMIYRKDVFNTLNLKFDENLLGYTIAEDIDFSYRLFLKHKKSLFITPFARVLHRISMIEREHTKRMSYINQVDHFYFNFKNMNKNFLQKLIFIWSLMGITILRPLQFLKSRRKNDYLKMKFYFKSLWYCLRNLEKIRKGKLRGFEV